MTVRADKAYGKLELRESIANHGADFARQDKLADRFPAFVHLA